MPTRHFFARIQRILQWQFFRVWMHQYYIKLQIGVQFDLPWGARCPNCINSSIALPKLIIYIIHIIICIYYSPSNVVSVLSQKGRNNNPPSLLPSSRFCSGKQRRACLYLFFLLSFFFGPRFAFTLILLFLTFTYTFIIHT